MSTRANTIAILPSLILAMAAAGVSAQESQPDKWTYEITPYVWGAAIEGREGVGADTANVSASAKDLFDSVNVDHDNFLYDLRLHGLLLGFGVRF